MVGQRLTHCGDLGISHSHSWTIWALSSAAKCNLAPSQYSICLKQFSGVSWILQGGGGGQMFPTSGILGQSLGGDVVNSSRASCRPLTSCNTFLMLLRKGGGGCRLSICHYLIIQCVPILKRKHNLSVRYLHCHARFNQNICFIIKGIFSSFIWYQTHDDISMHDWKGIIWTHACQNRFA